MVGRVADADAGTGRLCTVCDDLLTTSHNEPEPAAVAVQSTAAVLYPQCAERKDPAMEIGAFVHGRPLRHWQDFPGVRRGNDDCGTMFAVENSSER